MEINNGVILQWQYAKNNSSSPGIKYNNYPITYTKLFSIVITSYESSTAAFSSSQTLTCTQWFFTSGCVTQMNNATWGSQRRYYTYCIGIGN